MSDSVLGDRKRNGLWPLRAIAFVSLESGEVFRMTENENSDGNGESFVAPIAWLSTCLLAGGLGTMIDPSTHILWLRAGSFGLVAAVGLDISARMRQRRQSLKQHRVAQRRCNRSLEVFAAERDTADELRAAVTHLLGPTPVRQRDARDGEETRWSCKLPVRLYPVRKDGPSNFLQSDQEGIVGILDNLSNSGFGLKICEKLTSRLVVIALLPPNEQEFDLLAEVLWSDANPDGLMRASGRLLSVLPVASLTPVHSPSPETDEAAAVTAH